MKQVLYLFLACLVFVSCSNNKTTQIDTGTHQIDSLKQTFIPILKGIWVLTDYIHDIEKTKSPAKSSSKLNGIVTLIIDGNFKSDSLEIGASLNNHEGYGFKVAFTNGNNNHLKTNMVDYENATNYYELGYEKVNNETLLVIYHYNEKKELINKRNFSKVLDNQADADLSFGLQYIVNKKLFSGNYLLIDSTNVPIKIGLKDDGTLIGHSTFKKYYVSTDFMASSEKSFDGITFNLFKEHSIWLATVTKKDTTYLYSVIKDEADEPVKLDQIKYKLVRQP